MTIFSTTILLGAIGTPGYDDDQPPDPAAWNALDEDERRIHVQAYHQLRGDIVPNASTHALVHVIVENQIALGDQLPVRRTVERLMAEGLGRHEAIHAVAFELMVHLDASLREGAVRPESAFHAALESLTAEGWRRFAEEDGAEEPDRA